MVETQLSNVVRHIRKLAGAENTQDLTDVQLLREFCRNGDEFSFAALLKRHGPMVLSVCRHVLGHEQDAEDAFQATFLVLACKAASIRRGEALINWLHGVAFRMAMNMKRNAARRREQEARLEPSTGLNPSGEVAWREVQAILEEEIHRLPQKYRAPFLLCCIQTLPRAEAARQLGVKEGTVWSRLAQARKLLQARLTRRGVSLSALMAVAALSQTSTQAGHLHVLTSATLKGALHYAVSGTAAEGAVSAKVVALANGVGKAMISGKLKLAALIALSVGLVATGARAMIFHTAATPQEPPSQREEVKVAPAHKEPDPSVARIVGKVVDETGKPVAAAVIRTLAPGPATRSAADGSFLLALEQPAARYVTVLASADDGARQGLAPSSTPTPLLVLWPRSASS
jgi:RNA polymerase sigma factor (sigma-70 family)